MNPVSLMNTTSSSSVGKSLSSFSGLVVVEFASVLAGPLVGMFFAELGARVIKIENPGTGGDGTRRWRTAQEETQSDISAYFASANVGKESLALNLEDSADRQVAMQLIAKADILIHNFKTGDATRYGLAYNDCIVLNPRLIYASISGYGASDARTGYDAVIQAESGFMSMNGEADGFATKMPLALMDILAAHQLKEGILTALYERQITGFGAEIHVSLYDAAVSSLANQSSNYLKTGVNPGRMGSDHPNIVPYGRVFVTADKKECILAVGTDAQYRRLCAILGLDISDVYQTNAQRVAHREQVYSQIASAISSWNCGELLEQLAKEEIPSGRVRTVAEVCEELRATGHLLFSEESISLRSIAFTSSNFEAISIARAPHFDEHGIELRREFSPSNSND